VEGRARMRLVYQLHATGESVNGWQFKMSSKKIFLSEQRARDYIPRFTELCCDRKYLECAERDTLEFGVTILELEEE
jgi:hypothetical protein